MLGRSKQRDSDREGSARQPLLDHSDEDHTSDDVLFSVDDDEPEESSLLSDADSAEHKAGHVRFQEDVQVIGPPLRSTFESREAGA